MCNRQTSSSLGKVTPLKLFILSEAYANVPVRVETPAFMFATAFL